jgi:DNA-binding GntR family transcriptional regulator
MTKPRPPIEEIAARFEADALSGPDYAAAVLREAIVVGTLPGGLSIRQDELARTLNISKVPLREALRELQAEGLVSFIRNRGFIVTPQSKAEMDEVFAVRLVIEPLAARLSMPMITRPAIELAERAIERMSAITDPSWLCRLNLEFHMALYEPAQTPHLVKMIRHAHHVSHRYVHKAIFDKGLSLLEQAEHRQIVEAFSERDVARAETLLREHSERAHTALSSVLF